MEKNSYITFEKFLFHKNDKVGKKMTRKTTSLMLLVSLSLNLFIFAPSIVLASVDPGALAARAGEINVQLQEDYFQDRVQGGGFVGTGIKGANPLNSPFIYIPPNAMALAALYTRYVRSGNANCKTWADSGPKTALGALGDNMLMNEELTDADGTYNIYLTTDQGIALEFMSLSYDHSGDQVVLSRLENIFTSLRHFESSASEQYGKDGAYWRAIKQHPSTFVISKYEPNSDYYYCYANASFWAIIGMCKFAISVKGTTIDNLEGHSSNAITRSEQVIQFLEDYCYFNGSGFVEYPYSQLIGDKVFKVETQILAALAYTRLYQATQTQSYLDKANMMIEQIITKSFLTTGTIGGVITEIDTETGYPSVLKEAYENALLAYTLINLYAASGETDIEHLRRAEEIAYFLNEYLYDVTEDGAIAGYLEELNNGTVLPSMDVRLHTTQSLMMIVNEEIMFHERPWFIKYLWWEIIGAIVVAAVIFIAIGVKKKKDVGRKLPKLVKGLVED